MGSVHWGARRRGGGKNYRRRAAMEREKEIGGRREEEGVGCCRVGEEDREKNKVAARGVDE